MTPRILFTLCLSTALGAAACSDDGGTFFDAGDTDATTDTGGGGSDAGGEDAGATDTGTTDAGGEDTGVTDAGGEDAGSEDVAIPDAEGDTPTPDVGEDASTDAEWDGDWDAWDAWDAEWDASEDVEPDAPGPEPGAPCFSDEDCGAGLTCAGGPGCDGVYACVETSSCGLSPSFAMCGCDGLVQIGQVTCTGGAVVSTEMIGGDPGATCDPDGDDADFYDVIVVDATFGEVADGTPVRARFQQATLEGGYVEAFELVRDGAIEITAYNALGRDLFVSFGGVLVDTDNDGACDEGELVLNITADNPFSEDDATTVDLDRGAGSGIPGTCDDWDLLAE